MRLVLTLLFLLLPLPLLAQGTETGAGEQPSTAISVEDSTSQDAAIATRIRTILTELEGYDDVTVSVSAGIVTLRGHTLSAELAEGLSPLVARVDGVVAIKNQVSESTDVVERLNPAMERFSKRTTQFVAYLPLLAVALLAFVVIFGAGLALARLRQPWDHLAPNSFIADIYRAVIRLAFLVGGLVIALDILGATALLSTILGAAGIIGLAIGFAVKDTVENFIASIMLSIRQPFRPNDAIEINGDEGMVIRLTSRATILLSYDGNHIRIPNSTVFKSRIVNFTRNAERRFLFDLSVAPDTDLARALKLGEEVLRDLPFTLTTPAPSAWIQLIGDSTITLQMAAWIDQRNSGLPVARSEAIRMVMVRFTEAGIAMPEPTYRLITTSGATAQDSPQTEAEKTTEPSAKSTPQAADILDVHSHEDDALSRIIAEERAVTKTDDLLEKHAPSE